MKVSMENDNNFGYEKITIVVDNMSLTFNSYCRGLSDKPFICDCDMVPLQHYLSDMALLHMELLVTTKKTNRCIHYMNLNTVFRKWRIPVIGVFCILIIQYALFILGTGESCQGSNRQYCSVRTRRGGVKSYSGKTDHWS